jgi:hypothetical protein
MRKKPHDRQRRILGRFSLKRRAWKLRVQCLLDLRFHGRRGFRQGSGFTPADWLDSLLHGVCPMGESRNG